MKGKFNISSTMSVEQIVGMFKVSMLRLYRDINKYNQDDFTQLKKSGLADGTWEEGQGFTDQLMTGLRLVMMIAYLYRGRDGRHGIMIAKGIMEDYLPDINRKRGTPSQPKTLLREKGFRG